MNFFIPKSHKIRNDIMAILAEKRSSTQMGVENYFEKVSLSKQKITELLRGDPKAIDQQLDYLFMVKEIAVHKTAFLITDSGILIHASKKYLNEGKMLNSQLFNNYASAVFQVLTGLGLVLSLVVNFTTIQELRLQDNGIIKSQERIELRLKELEEGGKIQSNFYDTIVTRQTKSQISDSTSKP